MNMQTHSLFRTANAIGLAAVAASPAAANVTNQDAPTCLHWAGNNAGGLVGNSLRGAHQNAARHIIERKRASFDDLRQRFAAIRCLPDGWDGVASITPSPNIVALAANILEFALEDLRAIALPVIVPVADGSVQAEWYSPEHRFEIYFEASGDVSAWSEDRSTGVEMEADGQDAVQMLVQWTSRMNEERAFG